MSYSIAAVSFLNTVPLVAALEGRPDVALVRDVPSALAERLADGRAEAALLPVIDLARLAPAPRVLLEAGGIASDGTTLTVRVFSRVPPEAVAALWTDLDSHTSVALAQVLWREAFGRALAVHPLDARRPLPPEADAILLIGDKVVAAPPADRPHQLDLGALWRQTTGLPFVFAAWAAGATVPPERAAGLTHLLATARCEGAARIDALAETYAPRHGWPADVARRYLARNMQYELTDRHRAGLAAFLRLAERDGLAPAGAADRCAPPRAPQESRT